METIPRYRKPLLQLLADTISLARSLLVSPPAWHYSPTVVVVVAPLCSASRPCRPCRDHQNHVPSTSTVYLSSPHSLLNTILCLICPIYALNGNLSNAAVRCGVVWCASVGWRLVVRAWSVRQFESPRIGAFGAPPRPKMHCVGVSCLRHLYVSGLAAFAAGQGPPPSIPLWYHKIPHH